MMINNSRKIVNIFANYSNAILNNQVGYIMNMNLSLNDIKDIILKGNDVTEILEDNTVVRLTIDNYNIDFSKEKPNKKDIIINDSIDYNTVKRGEPIVENTKTAEYKEIEVKEEVKTTDYIQIEEDSKVEEELVSMDDTTAEEEIIEEEKKDIKDIQSDYKRGNKRR